MSAKRLREQIRTIRTKMTEAYTYESSSEVSEEFLSDVNLLQQRYGELLGNAKAKHQEYSKELIRLDNEITTCFVKLSQTSYYLSAFKC